MCDLQLDMVSWKKHEKVLQRLPNARIGNWMRSTVLECLWNTMKPDISLSQLGSVRRHLRSRCLFQWRLGLDPLGLVDCYQCVGGDESQSGSPTFERRTPGGRVDNGVNGMEWMCRTKMKLWCVRETRVFSFYSLLASLLIHRMLWKVRFGREKTIILDLEIISPLGMTILLDNPKVYFLRDGSNIQQIRLRCTTSSALSSSGHVSQAANWA